VPRIPYPGGKGLLAKTIAKFMPQFGCRYVEPCAGKGNTFWVATTFFQFEKWWINDLQTAPFFFAVRDLGNSIIVPPVTEQEYERQKAAFAQGSREALLLEPYFSYSGCGFEHSGKRGERERPTNPNGYQRTIRACQRILSRTNARITGLDFKYMGLEELGPDDFVYFDLPYRSGDVKTYSSKTIDFDYLFRLLENARFKWLLSEYPEQIYLDHFGDPCFVQDVKLLCTRDGGEQIRTECLWKNYSLRS
jgi:site-specific DNA-adenine methylase